MGEGGGDGGIGVGPYPPPRSASVDPFGLQTGSTTSTAVGTGLVAAGGAGNTIASALGLGAPAKVATAGLSLAALGRESLFCAGLVLIGLGIVLNVASLVVRRQLAQEYDNADYLRAKKSEEQPRPPQPPPQQQPPPRSY